MRTFLRLACAASLAGAALAQAPSILLINEIRVDQGGADDDEYFELLGGPPGAVLDDVTYLVIGDGTGGSGVIEAVVPLTGGVMPANGLFTVAEATFTLGTANLVANLNFENSDNVTHLVVRGFTGADGDDLDTDDDGVLDVTPWAQVYNAIGIVRDPSATASEQFYGAALGGVDVGPDGTFAPGHVYRCLTSLTDVRIGVFGASPLAMDPTRLDTPAAFNTPCVVTQNLFCNPGFANSFSANGGLMGRTGTGSISVNDNSLTCSDVPSFFGVFVQATDAMGGPYPSPLGGQFCVSANIVRMNQIVSPVSNVASLPLDFTDPLLVESTTMAGVTMYYQYFHRDTLYPGGGNWSNGIAITWAP